VIPQACWQAIRKRFRPRSRLRRLWRDIITSGRAGLGWPGYFDFWLAAAREWFGLHSAQPYRIRVRELTSPIILRAGTSDLDVFRTVILEKEYAPLRDCADVDLVVDCGANVGISSVWFLNAFPDCRVLAVEPDPENYQALLHNLAAYGRRATPIHAAVWARPTDLQLVEGDYRDGRHWARRVSAAASASTAVIRGMTMYDLLLAAQSDRISILKIDIEGAETPLFQGTDHGWLKAVDAIAIELHGDSPFGDPAPAFYAAMEEHNFTLSRSGELTLCRNAGTEPR